MHLSISSVKALLPGFSILSRCGLVWLIRFLSASGSTHNTCFSMRMRTNLRRLSGYTEHYTYIHVSARAYICEQICTCVHTYRFRSVSRGLSIALMGSLFGTMAFTCFLYCPLRTPPVLFFLSYRRFASDHSASISVVPVSDVWAEELTQSGLWQDVTYKVSLSRLCEVVYPATIACTDSYGSPLCLVLLWLYLCTCMRYPVLYIHTHIYMYVDSQATWVLRDVLCASVYGRMRARGQRLTGRSLSLIFLCHSFSARFSQRRRSQ